MELVYLWIADYKNIQNQGFNLNSKWQVDYDHVSNELKVELRTPKPIANFFGENISNITAIVGANGAGKSTLMELLVMFTSFDENNLHIILNNTKYIWMVQENKQDNLSINTNIDITKFVNKEFINEQCNNINPQTAFYYSTDIRVREFQYKAQKIQCRTLHDLSFNTFSQKPNYDFYILNSIVFFIKYTKNNNIFKFKLPTHIKITSQKIAVPINHVTNNFALGIKDLIQKKFTEESNVIDNIKYNIFMSCFYRNINKYADKKIDMQDLKNKNFIESVLHIFGEDILILNYEERPIYDILTKLNEIYDKFLVDDNNNKVILLPIIDLFEDWETNAQTISILFDAQRLLYHDSSNFLSLRTFIHYDWILFTNDKYDNLMLSTGEEAMLSLASKFYYSRDEHPEFKDSIAVLFLDEGEAGLHPAWQAKYIETLCDVMNKGGINPKIHLILTTHSPFVLSDLPRENVVFLKNNNEKCEVVKNAIERPQTFASNIHTLFAEAFFMSEGTIGHFAKSKIEKVLTYLSKDFKNISDDEQEEITQIIDLIGEPVIKNKLSRMLEDKKSPKNLTLADRIKYHEEELKKLKGDK